MTNAQLIERFYDAFSRRDGETMAASYADDAVFSDPVFPRLRGAEIGAMWSMLCDAGKDLRIESRDVRIEGDTGSAHWEAWYTFSATKRPVHNRVEASFHFRDGLITSHTDKFPLYAWCRMALGPAGWALGWSPLIHKTLRRRAAAGLAEFRARPATTP